MGHPFPAAADTRSQTSLQSWQAFSQSLQTECFSCFLHSASQSLQMPLTAFAKSFTCGEAAVASSRSAVQAAIASLAVFAQPANSLSPSPRSVRQCVSGL